MDGAPMFDLADVYEAMIDWPKRLAHEGPFYRRLFEGIGARRVADVACGIGHHAAMFHSWGLDVEGSDLSSAMIQRAKARQGEASGLRWRVASFDQPLSQPVDALVCVGNSLPLTGDESAAERAVQAMLRSVRPGGTVVVHALNLWRLPDGPCQWQKCQSANLDRPTLILKGVHRNGLRGLVDLVLVDLDNLKLRHVESVGFLGLRADRLAAWAQAAGASIELFGGYQNQPYQESESVDLVAVLRRPE